MKLELTVGQKVKVIKNETDHEFKIGQEVTFVKQSKNRYEFVAEDGEWWYMEQDEFELIND